MKAVISAGPTVERIDPVRFISNRSSGRMGYELAAAARDAGFEVVLVSGPTSLNAPAGVKLLRVESASEMAAAVKAEAPDADLIIMAAAVADYRPAQTLDRKLKKSDGELFLKLVRTEDILASLGRAKPAGQILVGFAAETEELLANARSKLERKNLDWIAANSVAEGFATTTDAVTLLGRDGEVVDLPRAPKREIARAILRHVFPHAPAAVVLPPTKGIVS